MKYEKRRNRRRMGTILLLAGALLLTVPTIGAAGFSVPNAGHAVVVPAPAAAHDTSCKVGSYPNYAAYDPVNHEVYVPNTDSGTVSILSGACKVVAKVTLPSGAEPRAVGFDPANNYVYVTDVELNHVYVVSGKTIVKTITDPSFNGPWGVLYDPGDNVMAIANRYSNTVSFIGPSETVLFTTTVGSGPFLFAYDPYFGRLLVTNVEGSNVTSMNAVYPGVQADNINIPVGTGPAGIAFDYADSSDYVANSGSGNVSVISGIGGHFGSVPVGSDPFGVVWDQAKLSVYVVSLLTSTVAEIQGLKVALTITGPATAEFIGITYDDATAQVFVTGSDSDTVYIYS